MSLTSVCELFETLAHNDDDVSNKETQTSHHIDILLLSNIWVRSRIEINLSDIFVNRNPSDDIESEG